MGYLRMNLLADCQELILSMTTQHTVFQTYFN